MRKFLLFLLAMILVPVFASAANQAISKAARNGSGKTETRVIVSPTVLDALNTNTCSDHTLAAWVKITSLPYTGYVTGTGDKNGVIMGYGGTDHANDNGLWNLCVNSDGKLQYPSTWGFNSSNMNINNGGKVVLSDATLNEWTYFVVVMDVTNKKMVFYINGEKVNETTMGNAPNWITNENPHFYFGGFNFAGDIDEVQIYNKALTEADVTTAKLNPLAVTGLAGYYTFDEVADGTTNKFDNQAASGKTEQATWQTATFQQLWANGLVYQQSTSTVAPTLIEGREIAAVDVNVTVDADVENGTLVVKNGEEVLGENTTITAGSVLTIEATPAEGYKLIDVYAVTAAGQEVVLGGSYTVVSDVMLTARFTNESYALTVNNTEEIPYTITRNGEAVTDLTALMGGAPYQLTLNVPEDKTLNAVRLDDEVLEAADGVYTFALSADATLTIDAVAKAKYTVSYTQSQYGVLTVTKGGEAVVSGTEVIEGTVLNVSAVSNPGYKLLAIKANGRDLTSNLYTVTENVSFSAEFEEGIDYCVPTPVAGRPAPSLSGVTGTSSQTAYAGRYIDKIAVTCGESSLDLTGFPTSGVRDIYYDKSDSHSIIVTPGEQVTLVVTGAGSWMHTHLYLDADRNGLTQEDVVFTHGSTGNQEIAGTYSFTLPADLASGSYRFRYMLDWDGASPCVFGQASGDNGEIIVDFTMLVPSPDYENARTITVAADSELGTVAIINPETEGNTVETTQKTVTIKATPAEGAAFINWTNAAGEFVSDSAVYDYSGEEAAEFTAHFGYAVTLTVKGDGRATLAANGQTIVSGSVVVPGTEVIVTATPAAGKALISVVANNETVTTVGGVATLTADAALNIVVEFGEKQLSFAYSVTGDGTVYACTGMEESEEEDEDGNYPYMPAGVEMTTGSAISSASRVYFFIAPNDGESIVSLMETQGGETVDVMDELESPEDGPYSLADGTPSYVYTPTFSDDYNLVIEFTGLAAIDSIVSDSEAGEMEIFNLEGVRVASDNLTPGIYVVRQGSTTTKVLVK